MQIIQSMTIDMARPLPTVPVDAVQGDGNTRLLRLALLENAAPWNIPAGVTAAVAFRKADGKKGLYDQLPDGTQAVTFEGNTVTAVLAPQALSCPGETYAAVVFHDPKLNQLATFPFAIRVAANPAAGKQVSNDYYRYSTMEAVSEAVAAGLASLEAEKRNFLAKAEEALQVVHDTATQDAPAIVCEAVGESFCVADASDRPLQGLSIYGKTTQNGTPTPETPVPLESAGESGAICVTVAGKNLCPPVKAGAYHGNNGAFLPQYANDRCTEKIRIVKGQTYTQSNNLGMTPNNLFLWNVDGTYIGRLSKKSTYVSEYDGYIAFEYGETDVQWVQLELGNTATAYEPYKETQTLTASTPNGLNGIDSVKDEIDFARGVRVQRFGEVDLSTIPWGFSSNHWRSAMFNAYVDAKIPDQATKPVAVCSTLTVKHWNGGGSNFIAWNEGQCRIDNGSDTVPPSGILCYELATPIETPLSAVELAAYAALHTNKPNTTVFNDAGVGVKLSYVADTKTYIDQKLAAISAAMLNA